jgi:hypothetical protein
MGYGSLDYSSADRNSDSYSHSLPRHVHKKSHHPITSFKKGKLHYSRSYSMDNATELLPHVPEIPTTIRNKESKKDEKRNKGESAQQNIMIEDHSLFMVHIYSTSIMNCTRLQTDNTSYTSYFPTVDALLYLMEEVMVLLILVRVQIMCVSLIRRSV